MVLGAQVSARGLGPWARETAPAPATGARESRGGLGAGARESAFALMPGTQSQFGGGRGAGPCARRCYGQRFFAAAGVQLLLRFEAAVEGHV